MEESKWMRNTLIVIGILVILGGGAIALFYDSSEPQEECGNSPLNTPINNGEQNPF